MVKFTLHLLVLLLLVGGASYLVRQFHADGHKLDTGISAEQLGENEILVEEALTLAARPGGVIWLDVRSPNVFAKAHIPGAMNFWPHGEEPVSDLVFNLMSDERFDEGTVCIFYCGSGKCNDSHNMRREVLQSAPGLKILVLAGGWREYTRYVREKSGE